MKALFSAISSRPSEHQQRHQHRPSSLTFKISDMNTRGGTVQLFHGSVCIMVLESRIRYGSVCLGKNYTVK